MLTQEDLFPEIDGARLRIRRWLPEAAEKRDPIVLLHDALGSIPQWRHFPARLAESCRREVIAYERKGHGQSSPLTETREKDYLHREALEDLPALLEQLGIATPLLVGHSDGGSIALIYAAHHQPLKIVSLAAHVIVEDVTLAGIRRALLEREDLTRRLRKYHGEKTETLFNAWTGTWLDPQFRDWDITGLLPDISCPVLAIQGRNDEYGSPEQVRLIEKGAGGPVRTLLPDDCGHAPHREKTDRVLEEIRWFVDERS